MSARVPPLNGSAQRRRWTARCARSVIALVGLILPAQVLFAEKSSGQVVFYLDKNSNPVVRLDRNSPTNTPLLS
jgi:hypothetical protein